MGSRRGVYSGTRGVYRAEGCPEVLRHTPWGKLGGGSAEVSAEVLSLQFGRELIMGGSLYTLMGGSLYTLMVGSLYTLMGGSLYTL